MNDTSSLIAALSILVAFLSALYSRWVWGEARRTNLLALHANRIDVFRAFNGLKQSVQEQGFGIEPQRVALFFHPSRESKFYFSEAKTSQVLGQYFDTCFALAQQAGKLDRRNLTEPERKLLREQQDGLLVREQLLSGEAERQLEKELCHAVRRGWWPVLLPLV